VQITSPFLVVNISFFVVPTYLKNVGFLQIITAVFLLINYRYLCQLNSFFSARTRNLSRCFIS